MEQLNLYLGDDKTKQTFRFFLPLYKSQDRQALFTPKMQYPAEFYRGTRFIIKRHQEKGFGTRKKTYLYRLFIDESQAYALPRGDGS